jgi:large subunit ribosomal protein L17
MRHGKKFNHLGRKTAHRKAMLSNMAGSLIMHKRINTTVAKAKALRKVVEPLITKSKTDSTHSRRLVFSFLQDKTITAELFREVAPKIADRPGGYTRIIRTGNRLGDNAEMCMIELVDFNEIYTNEKATAKGKKTRRRGGSKKATDSAASAGETTASTSAGDVTDAAVVEEPTKESPAVDAAPDVAAEKPAADEASSDDSKEEKKED